MPSFHLEPEVAGGLGDESDLDSSVHPPIVHKLHYVIEGWLGDEILECFPCFVVTRRVANQIRDARLTGATFRAVTVTLDPRLEQAFPGTAERVPRAWEWLVPTGRKHVDDLWQDDLAGLHVSQRGLDVLRSFPMEHCHVTPN